MADETAIDPFRLDLRVVSETLRGGGATDEWMASWLPATYGSPDRFREAMYAHLASRRGAAFKSRPDIGHDFYQDLVAAHLGKRRTALVFRDGASWAKVTYESLHARCNALAAAWVEQKARAGEVIALVTPPGADLAVSLMTSLRLGLVPALIPPLGPAFVQASLAAVSAKRVATSTELKALLGASASAALPLSAGAAAAGPVGSFSYKPQDAAARLLTPFGSSGAGAADVPAQALLDGAARDAAFVYALDASDVIAAPGFDPVRTEPSLLLAAFVAGASHASVLEPDVLSDPRLLARLQVSVLGVASKLRDQITELGSGLPASARVWFRSLSEVMEGSRWDDFWRSLPGKKPPGFGVVIGAASGGAGLFSQPSTSPPSLRVWAAPGLTWQIGEFAAAQLPALNDAGVFTILRGEDADGAFPQAIVGRWGAGHAYAGSLDIGPGASRYPHSEVERVVERLPGIRHASSFVAPGRWLNEAKIVLLAFVERGAAAPTAGDIEAHVAREMGRGFVPHRTETFPLRPRLREGKVDGSWCRSQYMTGVLGRKARSDLFVRLARIGYIFARPPATK